MTRQQLAIIGALALMLGVFMPMISVPLLGSVSYFSNGRGDGVLVLGLGLIALLCALGQRFRPLPYLGIAGLLMLTLTFVRLQSSISSIRQSATTELADNPFRGLAEGFAEAVQIQWGFGVIAIGAILVMVAGIKKSPAGPPRTEG